MENLRNHLKIDDPYYRFNREERNVAAILYHFLLDPVYLKIFLNKIGVTNYNLDKVEVYYEYAMARDLWKKFTDDNNLDMGNKGKRNFISKSLNHNDLPTDTENFNVFFGSRNPSKEYIVSPANWSVEKFDPKIKTDEVLFKNVCILKWCFNIKPDIVIILDSTSAISIETKFKSNEGKYSAKMNTENDSFTESQLDVQKLMMKEMMGYENLIQLYIVESYRKRKGDKICTWGEIFEALDIKDAPSHIDGWLRRKDLMKTPKNSLCK